jgi:hypothetical protein
MEMQQMAKGYYELLLDVLHESDAEDPLSRDMKETPPGLDSGEGLRDPALEQYPETEADDSAIADDNLEGLDDASYMDAPPSDPNVDDITKRQRNTKLFDCFTDLLKNVEYLIESIDSRVSLDLLDNKQSEIITFIKGRLKKIIDKTLNYQQNSFLARQYEENLYMFMLLRSEFLTTVKYIRKTLKLTSKEKNKNNKK